MCAAAALLLVSCGGGHDEVRTKSPQLPQVSGTLAVGGLIAPVQVVRDRWGVPHITAGNQDDLFFAQGFVQAQDRLFQMDLWRRSVQGRLSEVLGGNFVERDAMTRRIQFRGDLEAEWASYGADTRAIANAFVRGINAWVRLAHDPFPEEFQLAGWAPELWRPEDLLNRTDAFAASADARDEIFRARLIAAVGTRTAASLLDLPLVPSAGVQLDAILPIVGEILGRVGAPPFFLGLARPVSIDSADVVSGFSGPMTPHVVPGSSRTLGGNAWAIARSDRGAALLAADPHRPLENPSPRYLVHLRAPGWNVIGATAPWLPGVAIGHNGRVAWSMTASREDVQDVYVEKLNPANPRQVMLGGRWVDVAVEKDAIIVKGRKEPFEYDRLSTPHGVIIALDRERNLAYGVRWSGSEPGTAAELGATGLDRARSAAEFREALGRWRLPAAEFVYADGDGRIGRQLAVLLPSRPGWNGALPVPGHDRAYEWKGWQPAPPSAGAAREVSSVASASDSRARSNRIVEMLKDETARSIEGFKQIQHDVTAWNAERLVPLLAALRADHPASEDARERLLHWDRRVRTGSADALLYVRWEDALLKALTARRIPGQLANESFDAFSGILVPSLVAPSRAWFDGNLVRQRDALLVEALDAAVGGDSKAGKAGASVTFVHPLAVTEPARRRFNVGPFELPGYGETIFGVGATRSGRLAGPSFEAILDAGDWDRSIASHAPGQSGTPGSPHFKDLAALWAAGDYFPLSFSEQAIGANAESTLTLTPRE